MVGDECPARMKLFFVLGALQTTSFWILADSGSARNLMSEATFNKLPYRPPIVQKEGVHVVSGSNKEMSIQGWAVIPMTFGPVILWHEFGIVPELPLEVLIGGDILAAHQCSLQYLKNRRKRLQFGTHDCTVCTLNKENRD